MRDDERYKYILNHYSELLEEVKIYKCESLSKKEALAVKKAIFMDLFQIGEHVGRFSNEVKKEINPDDVRGITDIGNIIGHGYQQVDPDIIWDSIENDCPKLIEKLKELFE